MKQFLLLSILLLTTSAFSQTRLIAHKSHSGNAASYLSFDASGNFGDPPPRLKTVEKINDTTVLMTHQEWWDTSRVWTDTFYHHPLFSNPNVPVDSIKKLYYPYEEVEFRNFDPSERTKAPETQPAKQPGTHVEPAKKRHDLPAGKRDGSRKKSGLWLLLIGGSVFLGGGLLSRRFIVFGQNR